MQQEKSRKTPVIWTQREETLVAMEIQRMRSGEADCLTANGRYANTLTAQLLVAQRVLPPERRKSNHAFYYVSKKKGAFDQTWYESALARRALYESTEQTAPPTQPVEEEQAEPAADAEAPLLVDPEMEQALVLGSLMQQFLNYIDGRIANGVRRALIELRDEEERKLRANGNYTAPPPTVATSAREIVRRRVDVIGLLPAQQRVVEASPVARTWNIRFLPSGNSHSRADLRERVIICTKFVSHQQQTRYRQMKAEIHWANGGAHSVIEQLMRLSRVAPNGKGAMH